MAGLALPSGTSLVRDEQGVTLEQRWLTASAVTAVASWQLATMSLVFAVHQGWGGIVARWVLFFAVALGTYLALVVALDRTRVWVGAGCLALSHGPLPLPGWGPWGRRFSRAEMSQFVVRADAARQRAILALRLASGREIRLAAFTEPEAALRVEEMFRGQLAAEGRAPSRIRERGVGMLFTSAYVGLIATLWQQLMIG